MAAKTAKKKTRASSSTMAAPKGNRSSGRSSRDGGKKKTGSSKEGGGGRNKGTMGGGRGNKGKRRPVEESESEEEETTSVSSGGESGEEETGKRRGGGRSAVRTRKGRKDEEEEESGDDDGSSDNDDDDDDGSEGDDSEDDSEDDGEEGRNFTDENADWLKPKAKGKAANESKKKQQLMSSSDEDDGSDDDDDKSDEDDEEDDLLEVERQSNLLDAQLQREETEATEEYRRTISQNTSIYHLPTADELVDDQDRVVPPSELRERIDSILTVLTQFKERRQPHRSRSDYIDQLCADMAELFGYLPELVEHFLSMLGPTETYEFLLASDANRPLVIRTNTLKTRRKDLASSLLKRGVTLDPLASWSKVGLKITESSIPIGATPEYLAGHYMLQSAASLCPVLALDPQLNERVLDMSAAPGGKTSYVAQLMRNTGTITANDLKVQRQKATVANMHRLGVKNVVTCAYDGRKLGTIWKNRFDRVLLDAPCSGLGVVSRDMSVKVRRTMDDVRRTVVLQKELLLSAIDALGYKKGKGGYVVYSTCSVSVLENEEVVNYVLGKRDVRIVDAGIDFGKPGFTRYQQKRFHPSLASTRRFYPHVHNFDGFYVAKLQKLSDKRPGDDDGKNAAAVEEEDGVGVDDDDGDGEEEDEEDDDAKVEKVDEKKAAATEQGGGAGGGHGKGKKKKRGKSSDPHTVVPPKKKSKGGNLSVPPSFTGGHKKKKQSTNAKMTKPRRVKANTY